MERRELLSSILGSAGLSLIYSGFPTLKTYFEVTKDSQSYHCVLDCTIPESLSVKEYMNRKYEVYSFSQIKNLVDKFKASSKLLTEHRVIKDGHDYWYATFKSRQDFTDFIENSQAIGLGEKQKDLFKRYGFKQHWILPS